MTVPTNNEDRDALGEVLALVDDYDGCHERVRQWEATEQWEKDAYPEDEPFTDREDAEGWNRRADAALAWFAARRLPVSGDNAEARAEAERRWPRGWDVEGGTFRDGSVNGFILGAEWQSSQPREAAPSDSDLRTAVFEAIANRLGEHPKARNHEVADSGEYETKLSGLFDVEALAEFIAPALLPLLSRTSQPVQVEVTYDMRAVIEELNNEISIEVDEARASAITAVLGRARNVLAALGGGDQ